MTADLEERIAQLEIRIKALETSLAMSRMPDVANYDGRCVRSARKKAGWTLDQLAVGLGVTRSMIWQWESGRSSVPRFRKDAIISVFKSCDAEPPDFKEPTIRRKKNGPSIHDEGSAPAKKRSHRKAAAKTEPSE